MADKVWNPKTGRYEPGTNPDESKEEHESALAKEKYDPRLKGGGQTQEQVQASGGLGAYAKAHQAKKDTTTDDAAEALASRKKKPTGGY